MEILYILLGLVIGFVLAYLLQKSRAGQLLDQQVMAHPLTNQLKNEVTKAEEKLAEVNKEKIEAIKQLASATENVRSLELRLKDQEQGVQKIKEEFTKEFENLANKIFDDKSRKITEQNKDQMTLILDPFKSKLSDFEKKVEAVYNEENKERINLKAEIKLLSELNKQLSSEANNLATALKGDNKSQGNWGELILEKILERSGLVEGVEYKTQTTATNVHDDRIRPDVVIFLPENKHLIVDSKVSLIAYNSMISASSDEDRERYLRAHTDSVRSHVKQLGDKSYQTAQGYNSPDFVMLFMPIEAAFATAMQMDPELYSFAWDRKVVIVSPTTLLATLRTVSSIWMLERRTRNVEAIAEEGGKLYDKFVAFVEDMIALGNKLKGAKEEYEGAMNKLSTGKGNMISKAENMRALGAKANKQINKQMIERSSQEEA